MWIKGNYRRNLMDMHIDDWNPEFLSKINVKEYVEALKDAGVQAAMVKGKPHTGLCYYPTKVGRMHRGLKGYDFFGDTRTVDTHIKRLRQKLTCEEMAPSSPIAQTYCA